MSPENPSNTQVKGPQIELFNGNDQPTPESLKTGNEESVAEKFKTLTGVPLSSYYMLTSTDEGRAELERILKMSQEDAIACLRRIESDENKDLPHYWMK